MDSKEKEFIKKFKIFSELEDNQVETVRNLMTEVEFPKGAVIIQEGGKGDDMFLLKEGLVEISKSLTLAVGKSDISQKEKSLIRLSADAFLFFGEVAFFEDSVRTATVTAVEPCKLYKMGKNEFEKIGNEHPDIGFKIVKKICEVVCGRLSKTSQDVMKLTTALSFALSKR